MSDDTRAVPTGREEHYLQLLHQDSYSPDEAAEVLNIPERFILKAAFGGELKAEIVNGDVVDITRTDLVRWLVWRQTH